MRFLWPLLLVLACSGDPAGLPAPWPDGSGVPERDLGAAQDQAADLGADACRVLPACACLADPACRLVTEPCWCPFPACGPGSCICDGGAFLGCVSPGAGCARTVSCTPPARPVGPDDRGCFRCP